MSDLADKTFKLEFDDISTFEFPENDLFYLEINKDNVKYEFLLKKSTKSDKLICFGGRGGINQSKRKLPDFPRHSWRHDFEESLVYYADPTFHINKEIRNGWYMGTKDCWYLEEISFIILEIQKNFKVKNEDTLFYGTSAGGYSSLVLATLFKESHALVGNAQIIISNHYKIHYETIKKYCFEELDEDIILKKYGHRFNIIELFKKENYIPPFTYLVNVQSKKDMHSHCFPLLKGLDEFPDFKGHDVEIIMYHDDNGHTARNEREFAIPLIKLYLDRKVYNYFEDVKNYFEDASVLNKSLSTFNFDENSKIIIKQQKTIEKQKKALKEHERTIEKQEKKINKYQSKLTFKIKSRIKKLFL